MPRQGLRRAPDPPIPNQDGTSVSAPRVAEVPRLHPSVGATRHRRPAFRSVPEDLRSRTATVVDEPDTADTEEDVGGSAGTQGEVEVNGQTEGDAGEEGGGEEEAEEIEGDEGGNGGEDEIPPSTPLAPNLREISSLASWTVSTHKPGCGIAALRHPSPLQFWQSDGPQPHTLTLHFFKRVAVVRIRVYLDLELDESYTPTKMVFLAGMGGNDLVEFASWQGDSPSGWVDISLEGVGGRSERPSMKRKSRARRLKNEDVNTQALSRKLDSIYLGNDGRDLSDYELGDMHGVDHGDDDDDDDDDDDPAAGNILKAMVIQVKICENHQNGKDTHVRGFQVFARDDRRLSHPKRDTPRKSMRGGGSGMRRVSGDAHDLGTGALENEHGGEDAVTGLELPDWMGEPEVR